MTRKLISLAVSGVLAAAAGLAPAPAFAQGAEIEALKAQLAALSAKIEALEKAQTQTTRTVAETQATADKTADTVAQARSALSFAGDLRYRYEIFDVQYVDRDRERDRIRARFNANFRVNDTITGRIGIATGGQDPRSSNQTLTDQNQRKDFDLDVAYVTWAPTTALQEPPCTMKTLSTVTYFLMMARSSLGAHLSSSMMVLILRPWMPPLALMSSYHIFAA